MESQKSPPITITTKPAAEASKPAKSGALEDEKVSLVKAGKLPAFLQRKTTTVDEEEKKEKESKIKVMKKHIDHLSQKKK
jgi:hypothetical protein